MIQVNSIHKPLLLLISVVLFGFTVEAKEKYKKEFDKSYDVNSDVLFDMRANFADVNLESWDQNKIEIHVEVIVDAKSESDAEKTFDKIEVSMSGSSSKVSLKTEVDGKTDNNDWDMNISIKMPKSGQLDVNNSFGSLTINEILGRCDIEIGYGDLEVDNLPHKENDIKVSFGDGEIDRIGGGDIAVEFGDLEIDELSSSADITCSYGELEIDRVKSTCTELDIQNDFGSVSITLESGSNYEIEATSSFGDVSVPSSATITKEKSDFTSESIRANVGSGAGGTIDVHCSFGDVDIDM